MSGGKRGTERSGAGGYHERRWHVRRPSPPAKNWCPLQRPYLGAIGKQPSGIVEQHDTIAEHAPPLLGMADLDAGGHAIRR